MPEFLLISYRTTITYLLNAFGTLKVFIEVTLYHLTYGENVLIDLE